MEKRKYKITFLEKLLGGAPMDRSIYKKFIIGDRDIPDEEEEIESIPEESQTITGFHRHNGQCCLMDYAVKGFIKEAGNIVKDLCKIKALRSKIDNYVFIEPRYIPVADMPTGILERPLRGMTAQGPRVSIARSEYIDIPLSIDIEILLIEHKEVSFDIIEKIFDYGKYKGLGQWRNGGYGKFTWERI
jgi:hypothetical protein